MECGAPVDQIDALIAAGADVNARARHGQAPLHLAAAAGSDAAVARLLAAGAALDARDLSGWTPLHQAAAPPSPPLTPY